LSMPILTPPPLGPHSSFLPFLVLRCVTTVPPSEIEITRCPPHLVLHFGYDILRHPKITVLLPRPSTSSNFLFVRPPLHLPIRSFAVRSYFQPFLFFPSYPESPHPAATGLSTLHAGCRPRSFPFPVRVNDSALRFSILKVVFQSPVPYDGGTSECLGRTPPHSCDFLFSSPQAAFYPLAVILLAEYRSILLPSVHFLCPIVFLADGFPWSPSDPFFFFQA